MNCMDIIKEYLKTNGFDGLQNEGECGCLPSDLRPCSDDMSLCTPGYKVVPPKEADSEFDFYICQSKEDKPWE